MRAWPIISARTRNYVFLALHWPANVLPPQSWFLVYKHAGNEWLINMFNRCALHRVPNVEVLGPPTAAVFDEHGYLVFPF